jgi:integrase
MVDAATPSPVDYFIWCSATPGFGVRVYPTGGKVFVAQVRVGRQQRRVKIGPYGPFTVDQARVQAGEIIRDAARGVDHQRAKREARGALTVAELCDTYMEAASAGLVLTRFRRAKRQSTIGIDAGRVSRHIKPVIGAIPVRELSRADVQRLYDHVAQGRTKGTYKAKPRGKAVVTGGAGTASRVVELLGGMYSWAELRGLAPGPNPVRGVVTAQSQPRDRVLSPSEIRVLGKMLEGAAQEASMAVGALQLIALTGLRRGKAIRLQWKEIDELGQCLRLDDTKTGRSIRPIGKHAMSLLKSLPRRSRVWVFPSGTGAGAADLKKEIAKLFDSAGLHDVRSHDLRRTFGSVACDLGYSDPTIAVLIGHAAPTATSRHYVRPFDAAVLAAADRIAARVAALLAGDAADVVPLFPQAKLVAI